MCANSTMQDLFMFAFVSMVSMTHCFLKTFPDFHCSCCIDFVVTAYSFTPPPSTNFAMFSIQNAVHIHPIHRPSECRLSCLNRQQKSVFAISSSFLLHAHPPNVITFPLCRGVRDCTFLSLTPQKAYQHQGC